MAWASSSWPVSSPACDYYAHVGNGCSTTKTTSTAGPSTTTCVAQRLKYDRALRDRDRGRCNLARIDWTRPMNCFPEQFARSMQRHKRRVNAAYAKIRVAATAAAHRRLAPKIRAAMVITAATRRYLAPLHITVAYIQHHARIFLFRRRHAASIIQRRARRSALARLMRKRDELRRRTHVYGGHQAEVRHQNASADQRPPRHQQHRHALFPIMVATRGQDARQCAALQKVLIGRLLRMESSSDIAQNMMATIIYGALEAELNTYFRKGNTNTTYFTRLAQCLGNYLKGVEALSNDLSAMYVNDGQRPLRPLPGLCRSCRRPRQQDLRQPAQCRLVRQLRGV